MSDTPAEIVAEAEDHMGRRQFHEAARCFEAAAAAARYKASRAQLLKRAAAAYLEDRLTRDAGRCFCQAGEVLDKNDRAECLMAYWRALTLAIAGSLYDCGFEWKGEADHHEDHMSYQRDVQEYREEAERVLAEVLRIEGVDRSAVIEQAREECRRRQKDGWGASECWAIVANVTRA